jgi:type VI secretion system protein VasD
MSLNRVSTAWLMVVALTLTSCALHGSSDRVDTRTLLSASNDVNPDINGRPSPVVLRVFQLRGAAEFTSAEFAALYSHEKEALGVNLVAIEEFELHPGENLEIRLPMVRDTRYLGAIAAFRDINAAQWRTLQARPSRSLFFSERIAISVARGTLTLSVKH